MAIQKKKKVETRGRKPSGRIQVTFWILPKRWLEILESASRLRMKLKRHVGRGEVIERSNAGKGE